MLLTSLLLSTCALSAAADDGCSASRTAHVREDSSTILETARAAGTFETLASALKAADLVGALEGDGPFTVFAPTDEAFAELPADTLASLLKPENKGTLRAILTYHVVAGRLPAEHVLGRANAGTLNGQRIGFQVDDEGVTVDGARVLKTDIECSNGIIHVIDSVILPSTVDVVGAAHEAGNLTTLVEAVKAAGLVEALRGEGPFTVFAPTDAAFAALPEGTLAHLLEPANEHELADVLKLHVVPGRIYADQAAAGSTLGSLQGQKLTTRSHEGRVFVGEARVVRADVQATNGVVHVIDRVLLPE